MGANIFWLLLLQLLFLDFVHLQDGTQELDVVLLFDSSDSVRSNDFVKERRFALELVTQIYNRKTRLGLVTFGETAYSQFSLDAYNDLRQIKESIQYMWYSTGDGNVTPAIEFTINNSFTSAAGNRECARNILVVLTHSGFSDASKLGQVKTLLERKLIRSFVINFAGTVAETSFITMTNKSSRVITLPGVDNLDSAVAGLVHEIQTDLPNTGCGTFSKWGNWTRCSVSCGTGLKFRRRQCIKVEPTDQDCKGAFSEDMECTTPECTDPIDGGWSDWGNWGACSQSCDSGMQQRSRLCNTPTPIRGGKNCPGVDFQRRACAEWKCPDCSKKCPPGAHLVDGCHHCVCSSITVFGQMLDNTKHPVENADIFLKSSRYKPFARTDRFGLFSKSGICILNETIFVHAEGYESKLFVPVELNATHWTVLNATVLKYVQPVMTKQPHDKVRMTGQSLSLCCEAVGVPNPTTYKWFKDGIELINVGTNGTLVLNSLAVSDSGAYNCYTETLAGVTLSHRAGVEVYANSVDTCGSPLPKLTTLPFGCFVTGDLTKNSSIDIGDCGQLQCTKASLQDNGSCSDYWQHHCCNVKDVDILNITCDGFTYKTSRIASCECKPCVYKTIVSGRATGRKDGKDVPLSLGSVIVEGKTIAKTNFGGFFSFEVPKGTKRVVVNFHDNMFKKLLDGTKIIQVNEGKETFASVFLPVRPDPIPFHTENGTMVDLGVGKNGDPPAASLSILPKSMVTQDGEAYDGPVNATIHFMDPRDKENIDAANGDFVSESSAGETLSLKTFGMMQMSFKDNKGNYLKINKPTKMTIDSSLYDIPLNADGDPDILLWDYDSNKGIWVENSKFKFDTKPVSGRKKRQTSVTLSSEFHPKTVPLIDHFGTHVESIPIYSHNGDSVVGYTYVTRRDDKPKAGSCFASVSVYEDLTLQKPYTAGDIEVKAYVKDLAGKSYIGMSTDQNLLNGHVCLKTFCDQRVYISVIRNGVEQFYAGNHALPYTDYITNTKNQEIEFESRDLGEALDCSAFPGMTCEGPMYQVSKHPDCRRTRYDSKSFQFKFAPFTKAAVQNFVAGEGVYDKKLSWYPVSPDKATFRSCFIKARVNVHNSFDLRFIAKSHLSDINGDEYGSVEVSPLPDIRSTDVSVRGACLEFRCPGFVKDGNKESFDINTTVEARLVTSNSALRCRLSYINKDLSVTAISAPGKGDVGFQFTAEAGVNYGTKYGVYIYDKPKSVAESFCASGNDAGPKVDNFMVPSANPAVVFDCT